MADVFTDRELKHWAFVLFGFTVRGQKDDKKIWVLQDDDFFKSFILSLCHADEGTVYKKPMTTCWERPYFLEFGWFHLQ